MRPALTWAWDVCWDLASEYIRTETNSSVGKLNLILVVILACLTVVALVPPALVTILRIVFQTSFPDWVYAIPVVAFVALCVVAVISLFLVCKEGPHRVGGGGKLDE